MVLHCVHQVALLGLDLLSAVVTRLQERFRAHVGTGNRLIVCSIVLCIYFTSQAHEREMFYFIV